MKLRRKLFAAVSSLAVASAVLLTGCGAPAQEGTALKETGVLTLSVNPEIQIEYNGEGKVTALTGRNDDGKGIVEAYPDYIGKDCEDVLKDLIVEINEAGYFVDDIDGNKKNIVLQLEPGSVLPSDNFLADMSASTQEAVRGLELSSGIVTIDDDDYDPAYAKDGKPSPYITLEKAQEIALAQANVDAADAVFDDKEFDHNDGIPVFELEFMANGNEYEYDIHAVTGKVVKAEHKTASTQSGTPATGSGSTNYNDTDYGPNNDGVTDYNDTDYGSDNDGVTDYDDTDYGPNSDGVTDYNDTDYGPNNDGVTDYDDTDYGPTTTALLTTTIPTMMITAIPITAIPITTTAAAITTGKPTMIGTMGIPIMTIKRENELPLRHELKHRINLREDLVLSQRLKKLFAHDKNAGPDGTYRVTSLYFDTPYDSALREKIDGVNRREKFRLRYYGTDTSFIRLEKKYKVNGLCGKRSARLTQKQAEKLLSGDIGFLLESGKPLFIELYSKIMGKGLRPKTIVRYDREAFLYAPGNVRITLDRDVRTALGNVDFLNPAIFYMRTMEPGTVLEVKYGVFLPELVRMAVQVPGRQAAACSKYALCRRFD